MSDPRLTQPTHLSVDVLHRLMRIFMEHKTDVLPVVEHGRIIGQLDRLAIMEALSEIRPEGYMLTLKPAETADELLRRLDGGESTGLATINRNFEFNAVWGAAEILQAQGKIPQVKIWQPEASPALASPPPPAANPMPVFPQSANKALRENAPLRANTQPPAPADEPAQTITIVRETPSPAAPPAPVATRPVAENLHRELERGRLAINTLAALDLPLLACDGAGNEIFHNRAFADIRLRDAMNLKSNDLVHRAKDAIAESAMKGDLDIDTAVRLKAAPRGYECLCKAIRDYDNPGSRAVGYIFWLVASGAQNPALYVSESANSDYAGKTLPDILAVEEGKAMAWAMREADGNQSDAALLLGIPRQTFNYRYRRMTRAKPYAQTKAPKISTPAKDVKPSEKKKP